MNLLLIKIYLNSEFDWQKTDTTAKWTKQQK